VVKDTIRNSQCSIIYIQEDKWSRADIFQLHQICTNKHMDAIFHDSIGYREGMLVAWDNKYTLTNSFATKHTITAFLQDIAGSSLVITNVYGPTSESEK
jgi:hypothetical protein